MLLTAPDRHNTWVETAADRRAPNTNILATSEIRFAKNECPPQKSSSIRWTCHSSMQLEPCLQNDKRCFVRVEGLPIVRTRRVEPAAARRVISADIVRTASKEKTTIPRP